MSVSTLNSFLHWNPILVYHEVFPDRTEPLPPYSITQSGLRNVLRDFTSRGYSSGTLDDVLSPEGRGKKLVLTFDDGTRDFLEHALPVLEEFNFKATLFIVAGLIGGKRSWLDTWGNPIQPQVPLMDAREIRDLHAGGFIIGSHTLTHKPLPTISREEAAAEVTRSREILSELTGEPARWFAYPYLAANKTSRAVIREAGYEGACGGYNQPHERYYLNRLEGTVFTVPQLRRRTNGLYHLAREIGRGVKQRVKR